MNLNEKLKIYVVGFPKSGSSWLVRMISNLCKIPVYESSLGQELAAEINQRLALKDDGSFVRKVHRLPDLFFEEIDEKPQRIIYIYRDVRAVLTSAFFYFKCPKKIKKLVDYEYYFALHKSEARSHLVNKLFKRLLYPYSRKYFEDFMGRFLKNGIGNAAIGRWDEHLEQWITVLKNNSAIKSSIISYESLLDQPKKSMQKIISELELPEFPEDYIEKIIAEESIGSMKARAKQQAFSPYKPNTILRKGVKDDWKNYLTDQNIVAIERSGCFQLADKVMET